MPGRKRVCVLWHLCVALSCFVLQAAYGEIVGLWTFEEGNGKEVQDLSGKKHTGAMTGGVKWGKGKYGGLLDFDSTGNIEWQHHADFNFVETLTIMVYARIDNITPQEWVELPRKEGEYTLAAHKLGANMEMTFWINIGGGWIGQIPSAGVFPAHKFGDWHHYAVTYDGKEVRLYLDGKDAGSAKVSGKVGQTQANLFLSKGCCGGRYFEGAVDDFVMANHVMPVAEIADIATRGISMYLSVEPSGKLAIRWSQLKKESRSEKR